MYDQPLRSSAIRATHRTPQDLRVLAQHCRDLAESCKTDEAREPLAETANELEQEAINAERRTR